jgi:hypothetical protein
VFITPSILNKNGGDRLRKTSISSIFEEEILQNCRFWEVQTSGFGLCIIYPNYLSCFKVVPEPGQRNSFSKRLFVPQNTAYIESNDSQQPVLPLARIFPCSKEILVLAGNLQGNEMHKEMARKNTKIKGNCKDFCNLYQFQV